MLRSISVALIVTFPLLCSGCAEPRGPMLAGGREVKSWVADLHSPEARVRRQAVLKLGNVGDDDPSVATALTEALHDADALVRTDAVFAVVKLKAPGHEIVTALRSMARADTNSRARDCAGKALKKLGSEN